MSNVVDTWHETLMDDTERETLDALPAASKPLTVYMILSPDAAGHKMIDPADPYGGSIGGGCRGGFMGLVRAMGRLPEFRVVAFSTFTKSTEIEGVTYVRYDSEKAWPTPDVMVGYYDVTVLMGAVECLRIGMHHTLDPYRAFDWIDVNTAPSSFAAEHLRRNFDIHGHWAVVPNAIDPSDLEWEIYPQVRPVDGRCVYHTSPDRGLDHLLDWWEEIVRRVPHATLHVIGAPEEFVRAYAGPAYACSPRGRRARALGKAIQKVKGVGGVKFLGRLPRAQLVRELHAASCFPYPVDVTAPCETWSTSILECLYLGVPVVTFDVDAIPGLWGDCTACVKGPPESGRRHFVTNVCDALLGISTAERVERGKTVAGLYTFDQSAKALGALIPGNLARVRAEWEREKNPELPASV